MAQHVDRSLRNWIAVLSCGSVLAVVCWPCAWICLGKNQCLGAAPYTANLPATCISCPATVKPNIEFSGRLLGVSILASIVYGTQKRLRCTPKHCSATESCSNIESRGAKQPSGKHVEEDRFRVYIEDTDCFQVVFYANYFKYFTRYLCRVFKEAGRGTPVIVGVKKGRYARAARLGDLLRVKAKEIPLEELDSNGLLCFLMELVTDNGLCVSAEVLVAEHPDSLPANWPHPGWPPAPGSGQGPPTLVSSFEELIVPCAASWPRHPIPSILDVLRWFERSRTDSLGGPQNLHELQSSSEVLVVVARLEHLVLDLSQVSVPVADVFPPSGFEVFSSLEIKRRGTQIVFDQRLRRGSDGTCVARGVVTCLCIDKNTLKIIRCPEKIVKRLELWTSGSNSQDHM